MRHPDYHDIGRRFRQADDWTDERPLEFPEEQADLYYLETVSHNSSYLLGHAGYRCEEHGLTFGAEPTIGEPIDCAIDENNRFRYLLLRDHSNGPLVRHSRLLVLLHGLNERSFTKYIPWAYQVWKQTGTPVLLFPMTFHINRVRREWGYAQQEIALHRRQIADNENTHRFNAVISERLHVHPDRFFWGAMQSYWDLVDLVRTIRDNRHPHFRPDTRVDVLGYSAGGYIALALLLENPDACFTDSRGVMFASCAAMRDVNLASPLILDHAAELSLMKLYVKYREKLMKPRLRHWFEHHAEGRWFEAFCGLMPNRKRLEERLNVLAPRLVGITNANDQVMTPGAMLNALQGIRRDTGVRIVELDLGIHENPFSCPDYRQRERQMIIDFLDVGAYGSAFERFIDTICEHIA